MAPETVLGEQEVEAGTRQVGDLYQEEVRGQAACEGEVAAVGSCCSLVADMSEPRWAVGKWRAEVGVLEGALQGEDRREGGTAGSGVRSWAAWARRRGLLSSSWTAGSGSPLPTCRSWWWT